MRHFIFSLSILSIIGCARNESNPLQYIFYIPGGIVQSKGDRASNEYYGIYEYQLILDSLSRSGYHVLHEPMPTSYNEKQLATRIAEKIDSLHRAGVELKNITIVGASLGAYVTMELAIMKKEQDLRYGLLGLCSPYAVDLYQPSGSQLKGNFLSIYEASDEKGSCAPIFANANNLPFEEIKLENGLSHSFLYKPYSDWLNPLFEWIEKH